MRRTILIGLASGMLVGGVALAGGAECAKAEAARLASGQATVEGQTCCAAGETADCKACCTHTAQECRDHMASMFIDRGWAGLELEMNEAKALTVSRVEPGSPAMKAGFLEGDVLVALNGVKLDPENQEKVYSAKDKLVVGSRVTYTVERDGAKRDIAVTLAQMPRDVLEGWIARHLENEHAPETATLTQK